MNNLNELAIQLSKVAVKVTPSYYTEWGGMNLSIYDNDLFIEGDLCKCMTYLHFVLLENNCTSLCIEHIISRSVEMGSAIPERYNANYAIQAIIKFAKFIGCKTVEVNCKKQHLQYYKKLGFTERENNGSKFIYMVLTIRTEE